VKERRRKACGLSGGGGDRSTACACPPASEVNEIITLTASQNMRADHQKIDHRRSLWCRAVRGIKVLRRVPRSCANSTVGVLAQNGDPHANIAGTALGARALGVLETAGFDAGQGFHRAHRLPFECDGCAVARQGKVLTPFR
jgi:hypothetical protein